MPIEMNKDDLEYKIAQAAFFWIDYGCYGSEGRAISALRRWKGMSRFDREFVKQRLSVAAAVARRAVELRQTVPAQYDVEHYCLLSREQHREARQRLCSTLADEFPSMATTVRYMVAMVWDMPYER